MYIMKQNLGSLHDPRYVTIATYNDYGCIKQFSVIETNVVHFSGVSRPPGDVDLVCSESLHA